MEALQPNWLTILSRERKAITLFSAVFIVNFEQMFAGIDKETMGTHLYLVKSPLSTNNLYIFIVSFVTDKNGVMCHFVIIGTFWNKYCTTF